MWSSACMHQGRNATPWQGSSQRWPKYPARQHNGRCPCGTGVVGTDTAIASLGECGGKREEKNLLRSSHPYSGHLGLKKLYTHNCSMWSTNQGCFCFLYSSSATATTSHIPIATSWLLSWHAILWAPLLCLPLLSAIRWSCTQSLQPCRKADLHTTLQCISTVMLAHQTQPMLSELAFPQHQVKALVFILCMLRGSSPVYPKGLIALCC